MTFPLETLELGFGMGRRGAAVLQEAGEGANAGDFVAAMWMLRVFAW